MRVLNMYLFFAFLLTFSLWAQLPRDNVEASARSFVNLLVEGRFARATEDFDAVMKKVATPEALATEWKGLQTQLGEYNEIVGTRVETKRRARFVFVTCKFEKTLFDVKVVLGKSGKIAGMFFVPTKFTDFKVPGYVDRKKFDESEVTVGEGLWQLPGTLSVPSGGGPFPAVVLVHGSGPNDRDETIGANKPFRDIAWGLASKGVAVLRYEKRSRHYAGKMPKNLTMDEIAVDDALCAVSFLKQHKLISSDKIFIVGHSLGGMLAPRVGLADSTIAGLAMLASNGRPLEDLMLEQIKFQISLLGVSTPQSEQQVEQTRQQVLAIKALNLSNDQKQVFLDYPVSCWIDLNEYKQLDTVKKIELPLLILQGGKDCQVSAERDFPLWKEALADRQNVSFKLYPSLNHLFIHVDGISTGAEYQQPGNVAENVVKDIAVWILKH